mmetsp:Transcript_4311/g.12834  ORF Transcript_4311/g.12834 Transcript_4311/m.12834 type:complete len:250 (-) Transcript_4311:388-1137(-)
MTCLVRVALVISSNSTKTPPLPAVPSRGISTLLTRPYFWHSSLTSSSMSFSSSSLLRSSCVTMLDMATTLLGRPEAPGAVCAAGAGSGSPLASASSPSAAPSSSLLRSFLMRSVAAICLGTRCTSSLNSPSASPLRLSSAPWVTSWWRYSKTKEPLDLPSESFRRLNSLMSPKGLSRRRMSSSMRFPGTFMHISTLDTCGPIPARAGGDGKMPPPGLKLPELSRPPGTGTTGAGGAMVTTLISPNLSLW